MSLISSDNFNDLDRLRTIITAYQSGMSIDNIVINGNQLTIDEYNGVFGTVVTLIGTLTSSPNISLIPEAGSLITAQENILLKANTAVDITSSDVLNLLSATTTFLDEIRNQKIELPIHELAAFSIVLEMLNFTYVNRGLINDWVDLDLTGYEQILDSYSGILEELINDFWSELSLDPTSITTSIDQLISTGFTIHFHSDPLVLDLDGDGIETITTNGEQSVMFDHNGDGVKFASGWVANDDGFLVIDKNNNGTIDDGSELFGDSSMLANGNLASNGFAALADIDSNADGIIDSGDSQFSSLRVWRDLNQDGVSQANEIFTLADVNIQSLTVASEANNTSLDADNILSSTSTFTRLDGSTNTMGDINLGQDTRFREFTDAVIIPAAIENLPNIEGNAALRDLREAAVLSSDLATLLTQYSESTTKIDQESRLDTLINTWVKTALTSPLKYYDNVDSVNNSSTKNAIHLHILGGNQNSLPTGGSTLVDVTLQNKLDAIELIGGVRYPLNFSSNVNIRAQQIKEVDTSYELVKSYVYTTLLFQTRFKGISDAVNVDLVNGELTLDLNEMESALDSQLKSNGENGLLNVAEFSSMNILNESKLGWDGIKYLFIVAKNLVVTKENLPILLGLGIISKLENDDSILTGSANADILIGNSGMDIIFGGYGDDVLAGGAGTNDLLSGGEGNDTYLFSIGDGDTRISNYDTSKSHYDVLRFSEEILSTDVVITRIENHLILTIRSSSEVLTIRNYFYSDASQGYAINAIEFQDGVVWDQSTINRISITGTSGDDSIIGFDSNDIINGGQGNDAITGAGGDDTISGGAGNDGISGAMGDDMISGGSGNDFLSGNNGDDILTGGSGTDSLHGGNGNDILNGGTGNNDFLSGDAGNDIYLFSKGDGNTRISNYDTVSTSFDILKFSSDITSDDVLVTRKKNDVILTIKSTNETITLDDYFYQESVGDFILDEIQFEDGTKWDLASIKSLLANPPVNNDNAETIIDEIPNGDNSIESAISTFEITSAKQLSGSDNNDILVGGTGTDSIFGGKGNDILSGGTGFNDFLSGGSGDDTYLFSLGDGNTKISNYDTGSNRNDILKFSKNILSNNVFVKRDNDDLTLSISTSGEIITVENYFYADSNAGYALNSIEFSDGTAWDIATINQLVTQGTSNNNTLIGFNADDTFIGNEGNDKMVGRAGNDTYLFKRGDGQDIILDSGGKVDSLQFDGDINNDQLWLSQSDNNLAISIIGTDEKITIENWFSDSQYRVEEIKAGGMVLVDTQVQQLVNAMAGFAAPASGELTLSTDLDASLSPILAASWQ